MAIGERIGAWRDDGTLGQVVRFGVTGLGVTLFYSAVYWPLATYGHRIVSLGRPHGRGGALWPIIAVVVAFLAATVVGNVAHGRISFKGHGTRDERTAHRFFLVQLLGFSLNELFTWALTGPLLHGPTWWPIVPAIFVTPLVTFGLQRNWVYA